ncbi:hypothetical protein [uncultured Jatrophihabitans sp.]|uniref:hypothetical protein n=1 Tax=uncultured Jatrophihabitans sp. TaxID=1610747 RepID=UPI0035CC0209
MPEDRTVLDHLLEGRDALQREVARLTAAIDELDSVLGRIGSTARRDTPANPSAGLNGNTDPGTTDSYARSATPVTAPHAATVEPVNPPVEVEPEPATVRSRPRAVRKAPAKKGPRQQRPGATSTEPPKSIRVHVLEMLQAENREFGLAEIIDRVHDAGIQAHDDAVRSITIKLMKDGRVERVGRGQYRLARRGSAARASAAVATAPRVTESAPEPVTATPQPDVQGPVAAAPEPTTYPTYAAPDVSTPEVDSDDDVSTADDVNETDVNETYVSEPDVSEPDVSEPDTDAPELMQPGPADPGFAGQPAFDARHRDDAPRTQPGDEPTERGSYAPSLNLGQPWNS